MTDLKFPKCCAWCGLREGIHTQDCNWYFGEIGPSMERFTINLPICSECHAFIGKLRTSLRMGRYLSNITIVLGIGFLLFFSEKLKPSTSSVLAADIIGIVIFCVMVYLANKSGKFFYAQKQHAAPAGCLPVLTPGKLSRHKVKSLPWGTLYTYSFFQEKFGLEFLVLNPYSTDIHRLMENKFGYSEGGMLSFDMEEIIGRPEDDNG